MCVVSFIGDHYRDKWSDPNRWDIIWPVNPNIHPITPTVTPVRPLTNEEIVRQAIELTKKANEEAQKVGTRTNDDLVTREEFEQLKKEILEMKQLLIKAKKYDEDNNEPNCEMDHKVDLLKKMAKLFDVDLKQVFED